MYESLYVAVKMCMYKLQCFLHLYLLFCYRRSLQPMHCGSLVGLLFIKPIRKITYGNGITPILSLKNVFTVILIDFNFLETTMRSVECSRLSK